MENRTKDEHPLFPQKLPDESLNLENTFKNVCSTVTEIIEWDQQIPAFAKLSLNEPTRHNYY